MNDPAPGAPAPDGTVPGGGPEPRFDLSSAPPSPRRRDHVHTSSWGHRRIDPYAWMDHRGDEALAAEFSQLCAEHDDHARRVCAPLAPLAAELAAELRSHLADDDTTVASVEHGWAYFSTIGEGQQHWVLRRCPVGDVTAGSVPCPDDEAWARTQVLVDPNDLDDGGYLSVGAAEVDRAGATLAVGLDRNGDERLELQLGRLDDPAWHAGAAGRGPGLHPAGCGHVVGVMGFDHAGNLLVVRDDELWRPCELWRLTIGRDADGVPRVTGEELVLRVDDAEFSLDAHTTRHGRLALVCAARSGTTAWWSLDLADPASVPRELFAPRDDVTITPDVWCAPDGAMHLVWVSDEADPDGELWWAPLDTGGGLGAPVQLRAASAGTQLESVDCFASVWALSQRRDLAPAVELCDPEGASHGVVSDPDVGRGRAAAGLWWLHDDGRFDTAELRLGYASPATPACWYTVEVTGPGPDTSAPTLVRRRLVPGFTPGELRSTRLWAPAADGTEVPVTVTWHRDTPWDGTAPCVLDGYGSYGITNDVGFTATALPLLRRGVVLAVAHVRGGGEGGRRWWEAARLRTKATTFDDFLACADALVTHGASAPGRMCVTGASAGGLVVGNVVNSGSPLFAAAVAKVPFVDAVTTMSDPSLPLTCGEWTEWGNPLESRRDYESMLAWSPYDNVATSPTRPHLLVRTGLADPRVQAHEPLKWAARLAEHWPADAALVVRVDADSGHFGAPRRYDHLDELADDWAFVLCALGAASNDPR